MTLSMTAATGCTPLDIFNGATLLAVLSVFFVAALVYMLANFLRKDKYLGFARGELRQGIYTLILLASMAFLTNFSCLLSDYLTDAGGKTPFEISRTYLDGLIWNTAAPTYSNLVASSVTLGNVAAITNQYGVSVWGFSGNPYAGFNAIISSMELVENMFPVLMASLMAQRLILDLAQLLGFQLLVPLGILFRAFSPTRDAGSFLIATGFGLFLVLPLTFVMAEETSNAVFANFQHGGQKLGIDRSSLGYAAWAGAFLLPAFPLPIGPAKIPVPLGISLGGVFLFQNLDQTASIIPQAIFFPALSTVIMLSFIRSFSKFLTARFGD